MLNWLAAQKACQELHPEAHLVSVASSQENEVVRHLSPASNNFKYFWMGGTDSKLEGTWTWSDDTPFTYTNWYNNRPDGGETANCIYLDGYDSSSYNGLWFDGSCSLAHYYICEIDLQ